MLCACASSTKQIINMFIGPYNFTMIIWQCINLHAFLQNLQLCLINFTRFLYYEEEHNGGSFRLYKFYA